MKIRLIVSTLVLSLLAVVGIAMASTGLQTTPYSTGNFSAVFNGPVTADPVSRSTDNESSNYDYYSFSAGVGQIVVVRQIDHDIPVDQSSADFYVNDDATGGTVTNRSNFTYQGHVGAYTRRIYMSDGVQLSKRTRYIVVNSREVIFLEEITAIGSPSDPGDMAEQKQWFDFEDSLDIK